MEIKISTTLECADMWCSYDNGVIFVNTEEDIVKLHDLLIKQDVTWKHYKNLIKVLPNVLLSIRDIQDYCGVCGETDIWDIDGLKKEVDFLIYQY